MHSSSSGAGASPCYGQEMREEMCSNMARVPAQEGRESQGSGSSFECSIAVAKRNLRFDYTMGSFSNSDFICNGSNSKVYKVKATGQVTPFILKVIDEKALQNKKVMKEFEREQVVLARLNHPNIVELQGAGLAGENKPMLLLEFLNGRTLSYHMNMKGGGSRCFSTVRVLEIACQLCDALAFIHYKFHSNWVLIHRDLKPDNIGFTATGTVKLMDFGLCVYTERGGHRDDTYVLSGCTGSLRYMAPEVARRERYNEKVDIYSFGLIIYELAVGIPPFSGYDRATFYAKVVHGGFRPPLQHFQTGRKLKIFPGGAELMRACWAPDYRDRPHTLEVGETLRECLKAKRKKLASEGWLQKTIRTIKGKDPI
jgi:serine/threonine protein kinase